MPLKKCFKCKKNITKKIPGLECSRCEKIVHADPSCSQLSNKQINTLRNSTSIEWSCEDCMKNLSRRSSFLIPEDEGDENESITDSPIITQPLDTRKLVQDISREVKKTFREEISSLETTLDFYGDQIKNLELAIKSQDMRSKDLERKNQDLQNRNKNLELRVTILEQEVKKFEQKSLSSTLEIAGLPETTLESLGETIEVIAHKLDMDVGDILSSRRIQGSKDRPGPVLLEMKTKVVQKKWVEAGKAKSLTLGVLDSKVPKEKAESRVFIREALTKHLKTLLYNAKLKLGKSHQYIWCKDGNVCIRKKGNSKIHYIRSIEDIDLALKHVNKDPDSL
ncbi:hypothetical protein HF086_013803 [Spodoptera exigua]|uniref:Zinc finger DNA binding protein n=1 Tax=Spodoptera exigua TaxID=7107 RepID=A0A922MND0_SPOEX|nr:hypothetical protein HF086_013803 [Spodoptera exigua]